MVRAVNPSARRYRSTLRAEQAQLTRRRILEAATTLFVTNGYAGTTVNAVATEAGVAPETIYSTLGGKRGLLESVVRASFLGVQDPASFEDHERWNDIARMDTARERLQAWVSFTCEILARTSPIHTVIRGAADGEQFAAEFRDNLLHGRTAFITDRVRRYLDGALRPDLTIEEAGQRYSALFSPELHALLTIGFGWDTEKYERWLGQLATTELLGPE